MHSLSKDGQNASMPASLHIPPMDGNALRLSRKSRPAVRGATARRSVGIKVEYRQRDFEALMHTIVTCGTLWAGFWFQFVIGIMYNCPALHTLTMGNWFAPYVEFYLPVHSPMAISLAESFAFLSVLGTLLALVGVWHWTHGVRGQWRMRILVAGFAGLLSLWSLTALGAERAAWQALQDRLVEIDREIAQVRDGDWLRLLRSEKRSLESMLEMRPKPE